MLGQGNRWAGMGRNIRVEDARTGKAHAETGNASLVLPTQGGRGAWTGKSLSWDRAARAEIPCRFCHFWPQKGGLSRDGTSRNWHKQKFHASFAILDPRKGAGPETARFHLEIAFSWSTTHKQKFEVHLTMSRS